MKEEEFPKCKAEWEDGLGEDEREEQEINFEEYDDNFIIEQSYHGDLCYRCEYKIVEIK